MKKYTMFGINGLFGDFVEIIHANGGILDTVVLNVAEEPQPGQKTFSSRCAEYENWCRTQKLQHSINVVDLTNFQPESSDSHYILGMGGLAKVTMANYLKAKFGITLDALVHPQAIVAQTATLSEGVVIGAGAIIGSFVSIDALALVNRGATIGHDCELATCTNIGPGANLASNIRTQQAAVVGIGATILENVTLGAQSYIAGGAVVLKDVEAGALMAGVPAVCKKIRDPKAVPTRLPGMSC